MELVKNRASGKVFIVLDDTGNSHFLLITPEGKVKRLERHLFGPLVAADHKASQWHDHITKAQMNKYTGDTEYVDY